MSPQTEEAAPRTALLNDRIFVYHKDRMVRVFLADIKYIEAHRAYCQLVTHSGEYTLSLSLGALERQLPADSLLRVHRSYLVNLRWVNEVVDRCLLVGEKLIPVNRAHFRELGHRLRLIS